MWRQACERFYAADRFEEGFDPGRLASESGSADPEAAKPKVLVVDDEQRVADTLCDILSLSGFEALAAYDGWSALSAIERFYPDYLLSDVLMPRMNGVELAMAIRNIRPGIKILLFSGQVGISEILEAGQKRGFDFALIAKPVHPLQLLERLKAL
jgi:CheY-like chemotaxis protein